MQSGSQFESLFWLKKPWQELINRARKNRLPHALILTGPHGVGKTEFAQSLAKWLLCLDENKSHQGEPCGQCHSCNLIQAGHHPDYIYVEPEGKSKQILIGQIREVNQRLTETPSISSSQVLIINPADVMNINASNAFLKTLEEPPGATRIILLSDYYGAIMPTIKSRCQRINLTCPSLQESQNWLAEQGFQNQAENQLALGQNAGAPIAALEFLQNSGLQAQRDWEASFISWMNRQTSLQSVVESWGKLELSHVLNLLYKYLLNWSKQAIGVSLNGLISQELYALFTAQSPNKDGLNALQKRLLELLVSVHAGAGNYNQTLLLESILLDLQAISSPNKEEVRI